MVMKTIINNPEKQVQAAKKYGEQYSSVFQVPEIKEKRLNSTFKKYGTFCVLTLHEIQNKSRQTKQEKYGDPTYTNREKVAATKTRTGQHTDLSHGPLLPTA